MSDLPADARTPLNLVRGCVVATVPSDLERASLDRFRGDLLERIRATGARRAIVDVSAVPLMDGEDFLALKRVVATVALMGARTVVVGLRPGVASALVELDVDGSGVETGLDLDDGFSRLEQPPADDAAPSAEADDGGTRDREAP